MKPIVYTTRSGFSWSVIIKEAHYHNGRTALLLVDSITGEPVTTATVNIPGVLIESDEIIVSDYAENDGILTFLQTYHIVGPEVIRWVRTGYVLCPVVKYLGLPKD